MESLEISRGFFLLQQKSSEKTERIYMQTMKSFGYCFRSK